MTFLQRQFAAAGGLQDAFDAESGTMHPDFVEGGSTAFLRTLEQLLRDAATKGLDLTDYALKGTLMLHPLGDQE